MTSVASAGDSHRRLRRWWVLTGALLLVAAACLAVGLRGHQRALAGPVGPQRPPPATVTPTAFSPPPLAIADRSVPVELSIPAIGLSVPLSQLGLNPDGSVQVPTNFEEPGWFSPGPSPGQLGSAVILGHVDSYQGPAVFFTLRTLQTGDQVNVTLADGTVGHFAVYTVVQYLKVAFPTAQVYDPHGYSALQLVTCGGAFDSQTGHYLSNIVVYTSLVSITAPPGALPTSLSGTSSDAALGPD
jgi:sortase (surface protein transpeptidase)